MRRVLFFGNCQAETLSTVYRKHVAPETKEIVNFVPAYSKLDGNAAALIRDSDILVEQIFDQEQTSDAHSYFSGERIVKFPFVTGMFLFPFSGSARFENRPRRGVPNGVFTLELGCSLLDKLIRKGGAAEEILDYYCSLDMAKQINIDRLTEISFVRQRARDERAQMDTCSFIENNFRQISLFMTVNHTMPPLSRYLARNTFKMLTSLDLAENASAQIIAPLFSPVQRPIHPSVVKHFGLPYGGPEQLYEQVSGERLTFRQFVERYVRDEVNEDLTANIAASYKSNLSIAEKQDIAAGLKEGLAKSIPGSLRAQVRLAHILTGLEDIHGAIRALRSASLIDQNDSSVTLQLARLLRQAGRLQEAEETVKAALSKSRNYEFFYILFQLLRSQSRQIEAISALESAIELKPNDEPMCIQLIDAKLRMGEITYAKEIAKRLIGSVGESGPLLGALGRIEMHEGDIPRAVATTKMAIHLASNDESLRFQLCELLEKSADYVATVKSIENAISDGLESARLHYLLCTSLMRLGQRERAVTKMKRALDLFPFNASLLRIKKEFKFDH